MRLFIDTNIYLSYFRKSSESLSSLRELQKLLAKDKKLRLVLPVQTRDEYFRNRNTIAEQSRETLLRETEFKLNLPSLLVNEWAETKTLRKRVEATKKSYKQLLKKYDEQVGDEKTPADILIKELFKDAEIIEDDERLLERAYLRYLRGNPPRKNDGSYGDAIAWELLLEKASDDNLAVITRDSDFIEKRKGKASFNGFLENEWRAKSKGKKKVRLHESLGEFVNTVEKKETVKKEIVQAEKATESARPLGFADYAALSGSGVAAWAEYLKPTLGSNFATVGSTSAFFQSNKLKYCPYCGKDIENAVSGYGNFIVSAVGGYVVGGVFTCPHCNRQFDPNKLG